MPDFWIGVVLAIGVALSCAALAAWCCWKTYKYGKAVVETLLEVFPAVARGRQEDIEIPISEFSSPPKKPATRKDLRAFPPMTDAEIMRKKRMQEGDPDTLMAMHRQKVKDVAADEYARMRAGDVS